jgi:hypothetical protein
MCVRFTYIANAILFRHPANQQFLSFSSRSYILSLARDAVYRLWQNRIENFQSTLIQSLMRNTLYADFIPT